MNSERQFGKFSIIGIVARHETLRRVHAPCDVTLQAGKRYRLVLRNVDVMPHNVCILKPGTTEKVGRAADAMARRRDAEEKQYIPNSPDILAASDLAYPGLSTELEFTAPKKPGAYPYICTFPGHWRLMRGVFQVTP